MKISTINKTAVLLITGLLVTGCQTATNAHDSSLPSLKKPKMIIQSGESINSGSRVVWNIEVESPYEDTFVGVGAWNYAGGIPYKTRIKCNNGTLKCLDIKQIVCDLVSSTGSYERFQCHFVDVNGAQLSGDEEEIQVPYTTYDYDKEEYVDTLMNASISVDNYGGRLSYEIPTIFNVSQGEFVEYQNPWD